MAARCMRQGLAQGVALFWMTLFAAAVNAAQLTAARIWPSPDYTRITLEAPAAINYRLTALHDPARIVLELDDVDLNPALESLPARIAAGDPCIASVRIGRDKPGSMRLSRRPGSRFARVVSMAWIWCGPCSPGRAKGFGAAAAASTNSAVPSR